MQLSLYFVYLTNSDKQNLNQAIANLPYNLRSKILSYKLEINQWHSFLSKLLLIKVLGNELKIDKKAINIDVDCYGKPYLKGKKRQFNLSHAGEMIVLATDDRPVGIDVEHVYPLSDFSLLLKNCFSEEEQKEFLLKTTDEERLNFFFELWTLKESYIKALGKGMQCPLKSFSISASGETAFLIKSIDTDNSWYFKRYAYSNGYKCAVCAQHNRFPELPVHITVDSLLELI